MKDAENADARIAIIFDMDGVLIDSEPHWKIVEIEIFRELGVPLTEAMTQQTTGLRMDACVEYWRERYPFAGDAAEISAEITGKMADWARSSGQALPGVSAAIAATRRQGIPLGLATSSDFSLIEAVVERLDLEGAFSAIASASEVDCGKPDPAVYQLCARRLGQTVDQCIAIEDSVAGVQSATRAGMKCIAVGEATASRDDLLGAGATNWLASLEDLDPAALSHPGGRSALSSSGPEAPS